MSDAMEIIFGLFGGLAVFIFGMNMMSECLQKAAGEKMKAILSLLTRNPILGVVAGALTTAVLQSSSATTVMAIGFVSAGLMSLPQAISIILGANIGTTMTAQIIAFKISDYIYVFIFVGFLIHFISKSEKAKNIGQTIFAFGLLFLGIETMGSVMKPLASSPFFVALIGQVAHIPVLGVLVGTMMTLVGQSRDAKRTAVAHCTFNISGAFLFLWIVKPYAFLIQYLSPKGNEVDVISRQIANAHTGFNLIMTLIWIPMIPLLVKLVTKIVPDRREKLQLVPSAPKFLDEKLVGQPAAALALVAKEVIRCSDLVTEMLTEVKNSNRKEDGVLLQKIVEKGEIEAKLNKSINDYLATVFAEGVLTEKQASQSAGIMYVLCDIDRIGGLCRTISENIISQNTTKQKYSKDALKELRNSLSLILEMYTEAMQAIISGDEIKVSDIQKKKEEVMRLDEKMRKGHMERVAKKKCDATMTAAFNNILHDIDRMGNSCVNLVEIALKNVEFPVLLNQ